MLSLRHFSYPDTKNAEKKFPTASIMIVIPRTMGSAGSVGAMYFSVANAPIIVSAATAVINHQPKSKYLLDIAAV